MNEEIMTNEMNEEVNETENEVEAYEAELIPEAVEDQEKTGLLGKLVMLGIGVGAGVLLYKNAPKIKAWQEKRKAKKLATTIAALEEAGYAVTKADEDLVIDEFVEDEIEDDVPEETEDEE